MFSFFKSSDKTTEPAKTEEKQEGWLQKLKTGLTKSREKLGGRLTSLFSRGKIDEALYDELEEILLSADVGVTASAKLIEDVRARVRKERLSDASQLKDALKGALGQLLTPLERRMDTGWGAGLGPPRAIGSPAGATKPRIIMLVGVNGAGKTTTIGKLAKWYQAEGKSVLLAAGDTFRAAAREQLMVWGDRNNVTVITQEKGDSAAVIFDAIQAAKARGVDIVLADTAGRLPTQLHLMEEIKKVKRVIQKADPTGPHEILLVLDANTGQNGLSQVQIFDDALKLTGLVVTKLDGTAKGGVIAAIAGTRPISIPFIGVGEALADLRPFSVNDFVEALIE
ncbi:MAG: signal recognition particle-docking protein FtsY [Burkholderiales bacterium]